VKRIPILYLSLAVLVMVSIPPLVFYATKLNETSRQALQTNEQELQNTIARSIASQIALFHASSRQNLKTFTSTLENMEINAARFDAVRDKLEQLVTGDPNVLYTTLLDTQAKGIRAGNYAADQDPFLFKALERGFISARQDQPYFSEPVLITLSGEHRPVAVLAEPLHGLGGQLGMLAAVVSLRHVQEQLSNSSLRGLEAYVVDRRGRLLLHKDMVGNPIGSALHTVPIVQQFMSWSGQAQATETTAFDLKIKDQVTPMLGTYSSVPSLQWAVIAQKKQSDAYASVREMQFYATVWGAVWLVVCLTVASLAALAISRPIVHLTESSAAIARGDFSRRIDIKNRTEIGELAATFNYMTGELERYVERLKQAAQENHELFLSSIRMIAAAVDEKDPYTHGHAERVTRYSVLIASEMKLPDDDVYRVKISAVLHDVGKIGIEDRILKKPGALTPDEYEIMKGHTTKGANIVRAVPRLREMIPGIELHHESLDGKGYPHGLKGEEIPLMARIISVADTFDAMTTHRPYQTAMDPSVAVNFIQSQAGRRFDPTVTSALQRVYESGKLKLQRVGAVV
jgi:HD-GYP domain-containing protein (c-di-GMP phosphodiesterase class II)